MTKIQAAAERLKVKHGSWRKAGSATGINYAYLHRLAKGEKTDPSDDVLAILGLERRETFMRKIGAS